MKMYENCSFASGEALNLPGQDYVAERHICKLIAEILLTLERKEERPRAFLKANRCFTQQLLKSVYIYGTIFAGTEL